MSPFLRGTLFGAAIVAAFGIGFLVNRPTEVKVELVQPAAVTTALTSPNEPVALGPVPGAMPAIQMPSSEVPPKPDSEIIVAGLPTPGRPAEPSDVPKIDFDKLPRPSATDAIPPNDLALQMIRAKIGIKTKIVDDQIPPPSVLTDAKRELPQTDFGPTPMVVPPKLDTTQKAMSCKLLNTRDIAIDFETTKVGSTRIAAVELWTTTDGGLTWNCTDQMIGAKSPLRTRLGSECVYGFKLVFENELGLRSTEPKSGDVPDSIVELDLKSPLISPVKIEAIAGKDGNVRLSWTVSDKYEDQRSNKLEFSTDGCDWQSIDLAGMRRDGERCEVEWTLPTGTPSQVFFRVSARDLAGNQTVSESPTKMTIDLVAPEGKVTGVRSERTEPEIGPMPRIVIEVRTRSDAIPFVELSNAAPGPPAGILRSGHDIAIALLESPNRDAAGSDLEGIGELLSKGAIGCVLFQHSSFSRKPFLVKDWFASITNTSVVIEYPQLVGSFSRRDPFSIPVTFDKKMPEELGRLMELAETKHAQVFAKPYIMHTFPGSEFDDELWQIELETTYAYRDQLRTARTTRAYSGERCLMDILSDSTWKPTTAKPESYRIWDYKRHDPIWGLPPGIEFIY
jgi:hypothetical protein